jgi:hypothetical protein
MNRGEIRSDLRNLLGETDPTFYTDTKCNDAIYEACIELALESESIRGTTTLTTEAGTAEYALPANSAKIVKITLDDDSADLDYRTEFEMDRDYPNWREAASGAPRYWLLGDTTNYLRLYPTPDSARSLKLYWYGMPVDFASDDEEAPFPAFVQPALKYKAAALLLLGDAGTSQDWRVREFEAIFSRWAARYQAYLANPTAGPIFITSTGG